LGRRSAFWHVLLGGGTLSIVLALFEAINVIHIYGYIDIVVDFVKVQTEVVLVMGVYSLTKGDVLWLFVR
jgi:hypothetical protein